MMERCKQIETLQKDTEESKQRARRTNNRSYHSGASTEYSDGVVKGVCARASRVLGGSKSKSRQKPVVCRTANTCRTALVIGILCIAAESRNEKRRLSTRRNNNLDTVYEEMCIALTTMSE